MHLALLRQHRLLAARRHLLLRSCSSSLRGAVDISRSRSLRSSFSRNPFKISNRSIASKSYPASLISFPTSSSVLTATTMVNAHQRSNYATIASSNSSTTQSANPYAPSLSHLNSAELPRGFERPDKTSTHATFLPTIEQSPNDDRAYRLVRLDNGMECLVVSDPKTDKSAAGISVRVGHLSDPENAQGMAHFCEHLLFMGTEKVC